MMFIENGIKAHPLFAAASTPCYSARLRNAQVAENSAKYLVDDQGAIRYLVDPGITGQLTRRDDGSEVRKYGAPQTELMAMITDGILTQRLPWTLVLLGVFVALVLELARVPSLPFAVGVYLPFSTSAPAFVGGLVRWLADRGSRKSAADAHEAESEMTPGVLLSTGYIAGGAIGGVVMAFLYFSDRIPALGMFGVLVVVLLLVGRGWLLKAPGGRGRRGLGL